LRTLSVTQQREVLENSKRVTRVGPSVCVVPSGRLRLKILGEQHAAIFLYDLC
jgi:hypothetical protein